MSAAPILLFAAMWCAAYSSTAVGPNVTATAVTNNATGASGDGPEASRPPTIVVYNSSGNSNDDDGVGTDDNRDSRFLSFSLGSDSAAVTNSLQEKQDDSASDPSAHLIDIYTDCLLQLSFPCVQRKLLLFLDKLGRMKGKRPYMGSYSLVGVRVLFTEHSRTSAKPRRRTKHIYQFRVSAWIFVHCTRARGRPYGGIVVVESAI